MKNKFLTILFWLIAIATGVIGGLCIVYSRIPEGLIILGALAVVIVLTLIITKSAAKPSRKAIIKAAGRTDVTLEGACRINNGSSELCILKLCENGVFLDTQSDHAMLIRYSDIEQQDSGSVHHIQFNIKDVGVCRFVCNNMIKIRAIEQALSLRQK